MIKTNTYIPYSRKECTTMMNNTIFATIVSSLTDLNDAQGAQVLSVINGLRSMTSPVSPTLPVAQPNLTIEEDTKSKTVIEGKKLWQEDFATVSLVGKEYRLYITCPVKGEKGDKIRYAIKTGAKKDYGAKFGGDYKAGKIYWVFPDASTAKKYIADRKFDPCKSPLSLARR